MEKKLKEDKFECMHEGRCQFDCAVCMPNGDRDRCKNFGTSVCDDCKWECEELQPEYDFGL